MFNQKKILMLMVDGFGIPREGWFNSIFSKFCTNEFINLLYDNSIDLDATLRVEGMPKSATNQASMFTGINVANLIGFHKTGFPSEKMKDIIRENNILRKLYKEGKKVKFANAYIQASLEDLALSKYCSVTTAMLYSIFNTNSGIEELKRGEAVFHDITRETLFPQLNNSANDVITPEKAAEDLLNIAGRNDFTLFEYFRTDRAGHKGDINSLSNILDSLSRFLCYLNKNKTNDMILLFCSDHGNCEDPNIKSHTFNKVPLMILKENPVIIDKESLCSIIDIYNLIIRLLDSGVD